MAWVLWDTYQLGLSLTIKLYQTEDQQHLQMRINYHLDTFEVVCNGTFIRFTVDGKQYFAYSISIVQDIVPLKIYVENAQNNIQ
jgi:hypothetical protein